MSKAYIFIIIFAIVLILLIIIAIYLLEEENRKKIKSNVHTLIIKIFDKTCIIDKKERENEVIEKQSIVISAKIKDFQSLAPTDKADNFDIYDEIITKVLEEQNENDFKLRNRNIAITGIYSGGKSSIIKTFLSNHQEKKALIISLGKYCSAEKEPSAEEIEFNLLQQIIYHVEPKKLPFSEINRIDMDEKNVKRKSLILAAFFVILLEYIIFFHNYSLIKNIISDISCLSYIFISIIIISILFFSIYLLHLLFKKLYSKLRNFKIKIMGKIEVEQSNISMFRKSIGEFIHFFKQTDYDLVIFEDIDRLKDSILLFTKIKELNIILNNAIGRDIQFIYELNDSIFDSSENRTKFFDAIIPIVAYTNSQESSNILQDLFSELAREKLKISDYEYVGAYTENSRIANDIYNEFLVYYKCNKEYINNDRNFVNLFYLIAYKVLFPKRFDSLLKGENSLAYFLTDSFRKEIVESYLKIRKLELEDKISTTKKDIEEKFDNIVEKFIINIELFQENEDNDMVFYVNDNKLLDLLDLRNNHELIHHLNIDNLELCEIDEDGEVEVIATEEKIFKNTTKDNFFNEITKTLNNEKIEELRKELGNIDSTIRYNSIETKFIVDLLKTGEKNRYEELSREEQLERSLNSFEERLIEKNFIDPYYKTLLTVQKEKDKNIVVTKLIIQDLLKGINREYDLPLDNAQYYVEIHKDEFNRDSFCMRDFYKVIVKNCQKDLIDLIFNNLTIYKLVNIMNMENDGIRVLKMAKRYFDKIWKILEYNLDLPDEEINLRDFYIVKTLEYADIEQMRNNRNFINNVENIKNIDMTIHWHYDVIKENLKNYDFDFKQQVFDENSTNFYNYIYEYCELKENIFLFRSLLKYMKITINKILPLTSYLNLKNDYNKIFNYAMNHLQHLILGEDNELEDSEDVINSVIKDGYLDDLNLFKNIINIEKIKFRELSKIDDKFYQSLIEYEKIEMNLNNLSVLFEHKDQISDINGTLLDYANNACHQLVKIEYDKEFDNVLKYIIIELDIDMEAFKVLTDYYFMDGRRFSRYVPKILPEKLQYLINKNYIKSDKIESIIEIDNNTELDKDTKIIYIQNSFEQFKENVYENMTLSILEKLLLSNINIQEKVDYSLKYKNTYGDELYTLIAKNTNFDKCRLSKEDLFNITSKINNHNGIIYESEKIKVINCLDYNIDILSNDELKNELSRIDDKFKNALTYNGLPKYLDKKYFTEKLLNKLESRGILKYEDHGPNSYLINRRTPKKK